MENGKNSRLRCVYILISSNSVTFPSLLRLSCWHAKTYETQIYCPIFVCPTFNGKYEIFSRVYVYNKIHSVLVTFLSTLYILVTEYILI